MIVPYENNAVALADETSPKRSNLNPRIKPEKPSAKLRSASSNKQTDMIVPRFGGVSSLPTNDLMGGPNPLAIMQEVQKQIMGVGGGGMFDFNPFEGLANAIGNSRGPKIEMVGIMGLQNCKIIFAERVFKNFSNQLDNRPLVAEWERK